IGFQCGMKKRAVDGYLEESALRLAIDGLGIGPTAIPKVFNVVPLRTGAAVDEICDGIDDSESTGL
ncbi:MAG: hypothetical protein Q9198_007361, partial [Flavoplaca austrocitrina]